MIKSGFTSTNVLELLLKPLLLEPRMVAIIDNRIQGSANQLMLTYGDKSASHSLQWANFLLQCPPSSRPSSTCLVLLPSYDSI
jgi:hypothetical protein